MSVLNIARYVFLSYLSLRFKRICLSVCRRSGNADLRNRVPKWAMGEMHCKDPQIQVETENLEREVLFIVPPKFF